MSSKNSSRRPKSKRNNDIPNLDGDPTEVFAYGKKLFNGEGIPVNKRESSKYIKAAADKGNTDAMIMYGKMLISGEGVAKNPEEGKTYLKNGAQTSNNYEAMFEYAIMCEEENTTSSLLEAQIYYMNASADQNPEHCYRCGQLFLKQSSGHDFSYQTAKDKFKIAADQGYEPAILSLALMLNETNKKEAAKYFKSGAELGDKKCMFHYSLLLLEGSGVPQNKEEGMAYLKQAVELNEPDALNKYGEVLFNGEFNSPVDKEEAVKYFKKAVDLGQIDAMVNYGIALLNGEGVAQNKGEAVQLFKSAADKGQSDGMVNYALCLIGAPGSQSADNERAIDLLKKAADAKNLYAMHHFARLVLKEHVCENRKDDATFYLKQAVKREFTPSLILYASLFLNKDDENYNNEEGLKYLKQAADLGDEQAKSIYQNYCQNGQINLADLEQNNNLNNKSVSTRKTSYNDNQNSNRITSSNENNNNSSKCCILV